MDDEYCTHCSGFGSSLKDSGDGPCTQCGGTGLAEDQEVTQPVVS
jgi:DnaJ-class molecular chaperone